MIDAEEGAGLGPGGGNRVLCDGEDGMPMKLRVFEWDRGGGGGERGRVCYNKECHLSAVGEEDVKSRVK